MGIDTTRGFVAFPRGLIDWEWYTEPNTARLFFHLLLTANWQEKQVAGHHHPPRRTGYKPISAGKTAEFVNSECSDCFGALAGDRLCDSQNRAKIQRCFNQ